MLTKFQSETENLDWSYAQDAGLTWYDMLKLASIVQAEATAGDEATVASVFYNRIAQNMPLQSDATSAYSAGGLPTVELLSYYSDPNYTYSYDDLGVSIPTPINNPGAAALAAVCNPDTTDYLYFYAATDEDGNTVTIFSTTYEEHLAAIAADQ